MKRVVAALATVGLLVGAIYFGRNSNDGSTHAPSGDGERSESIAVDPDAPRPEETPEQCIEAMFAAAKSGDVASYIECFIGSERAQIERELSKQPRELFAKALSDALLPLKGRAIVSQPISGDAQVAQITVERVYANHNELQTFQLRVVADRWRIFRVGDAQTQKPPISYGTPVTEPPAD